MTSKRGNKTQTEAGGTGDVSSESGDSLPGMPGTLSCRGLVDRETQTVPLSSPLFTVYNKVLSRLFSLKRKIRPSNIL